MDWRNKLKVTCVAALLLVQSALPGQPRSDPARTISIRFQQQPEGGLTTYLTNAFGVERPLDYGSLVVAIIEVLNRGPFSLCQVQRTEAIRLSLERDSRGVLGLYVTDPKGKTLPFRSSDFFSSMARLVQECPADAPLPPAGGVSVYFERGTNELEPTIIHSDGRRERLTLGSITTAIAELLPNCNYDAGRVMYITFSKKSDGFWDTYLVNAHGLRQPLTMNGLIVAAAETLQECDPEKEHAVSRPPGVVLPIRFGKDAAGHLVPIAVNPLTHTEQPLTLGSLLSTAAALVPGCTLSSTPSESIKIELDATGHPRIIDRKGNRRSINFIKDLMDASADYCKK
jgi:hypothetical protein